jgi:hypothetical protein
MSSDSAGTDNLVQAGYIAAKGIGAGHPAC